MSVKIGLELTGFEQFRGALGGAKFQKALERRVGRATGRGAKILVREIRQNLRKGVMPQNAVLTMSIKHTQNKSKALVDRGDLWKAVGSDQQSWRTATVGVNYKHGVFDIAQMMEYGATIPVTEKMRTMFFYLWVASEKQRLGHTLPPLTGRAEELFKRFQQWKPIRKGTRVIRISARPFMHPVMEDAAVQEQIKAEWREAVRLAFEDVAR